MRRLARIRSRIPGDAGRWAVARFALSGLIALILLSWGVAQVIHREVDDATLQDAKAVARIGAEGVVQPALTPGLLRGDPQAVADFDAIVRTRLLRRPMVRVKLWDTSGTVLYSDERLLIGRRFPLKEDALGVLRTGRDTVEISDGSAEENVLEGSDRDLVEVYTRIRGPGGVPLMYESYTTYGVAAASGARLWSTILPAMVGGLLLLWLVQLPMAAQLARRRRRVQDEREVLLRRGLESSALERRRMARDLHDGPVQGLAAVSYQLGAASARLRAGDSPDAVATRVDAAADATRTTIAELRTMLVDLYPPRLQRDGLEAALGELLEPLSARAVATSLKVDEEAELAVADQALIYRVAQESLRNVMTHADAGHVDVRVSSRDHAHVLEIRDDGCGFDPEAGAGDDRSGHFGLRMLADLARDVGGDFLVTSARGRGTTIRLEVPA